MSYKKSLQFVFLLRSGEFAFPVQVPDRRTGGTSFRSAPQNINKRGTTWVDREVEVDEVQLVSDVLDKNRHGATDLPPDFSDRLSSSGLAGCILALAGRSGEITAERQTDDAALRRPASHCLTHNLRHPSLPGWSCHLPAHRSLGRQPQRIGQTCATRHRSTAHFQVSYRGNTKDEFRQASEATLANKRRSVNDFSPTRAWDTCGLNRVILLNTLRMRQLPQQV